jgi:hypothetical protein
MSTWDLMYRDETAVVTLHEGGLAARDADRLIHAVLTCLEDPYVCGIEIACDECAQPGTALVGIMAALEHGTGFTEKPISCPSIHEPLHALIGT